MKYVNLTDRHRLPHASGIYFLEIDGAIVYVGQSIDLNQRWNAEGDRRHAKLNDAIVEKRRGKSVRLLFFLCPKIHLDFIEAIHIGAKKKLAAENGTPFWNRAIPIATGNGNIKKPRYNRKKSMVLNR
jgi:hypothetical protein